MWAQWEGSTPQPSGLRQRKRMELLLRLGLGIIYIAPLHGRTDLTIKVWVRSLGTAWEGVRHPISPNLRVGFHSLYLTF